MALPGAFPFPPHLVPKDDVTHPESVDPRGANKMTSYLCTDVIHVWRGHNQIFPRPCLDLVTLCVLIIR